ncbi:hypothetical protein CPB83DRAFT_837341 [Crepidotus variabilis]|uniref:Uncharacterized protein n=1 Tax=Crepidotus variabilis TaxID=179855 RepID=A0A9P6ECH8_9AGAR|nr:hypothetical protein CPB83DRAFT_837341 [Crepidotus variabilis]
MPELTSLVLMAIYNFASDKGEKCLNLLFDIAAWFIHCILNGIYEYTIWLETTLRQSSMQRHDYKAMMRNIFFFKNPIIIPADLLLIISVTGMIVLLLVYATTNIDLVEQACPQRQVGGGTSSQHLAAKNLVSFVHPEYTEILGSTQGEWKYQDHIAFDSIKDISSEDNQIVIAAFMPFNELKTYINVKDLAKIGTKHKLKRCSKKSRSTIETQRDDRKIQVLLFLKKKDVLHVVF